MAHTTKTDKTSLAQRRKARLAAELRSNLRKRRQQVRRRAQRADAADAAGTDSASAPSEPERR
jgi:hypothetical protein